MSTQKVKKMILVMLEENENKFSDVKENGFIENCFDFKYGGNRFQIRQYFAYDEEYEKTVAEYTLLVFPKAGGDVPYNTEHRDFWDKDSKALFEALFIKVKGICFDVDSIFDDILGEED